MLEGLLKNPWEFQQTFETPLKTLRLFVKMIQSVGEPLQAGSLTIDLVVFEPKDLIGMLTRYSIPSQPARGLCLIAGGEQEVEELLVTVLSEWIDFLFIPQPELFVIYADHDEYTTFYTHTRTKLERLAHALSAQGFKAVPNYERQF